jgi:hypothetical protein
VRHDEQLTHNSYQNSYDKQSSVPVAIKIIDLEGAEDDIEDIHAEVRMLSAFDSESVTRYDDCQPW